MAPKHDDDADDDNNHNYDIDDEDNDKDWCDDDNDDDDLLKPPLHELATVSRGSQLQLSFCSFLWKSLGSSAANDFKSIKSKRMKNNKMPYDDDCAGFLENNLIVSTIIISSYL